MFKYLNICFVVIFFGLNIGLAEADASENKESVFPLWKSLAEDLGAELPLPYGISIAKIGMSAPLRVKQAKLNALGSEILTLDESEVEVGIVDADNLSLRIDTLVLPFLNVYGFYGNTSGDVDLDIHIPTAKLPFPINLAADLVTGGEDIVISENFEFSGPTYGGGVSFIMGYPFESGDSLFVMADANFSWTDLDVVDTTIQSTMLSYRVGWDTKIKGKSVQFWVGAMDNLASQEASIPLTKLSIPLLSDLDVKLDVEDNSGQTPMAGVAYQFNENWMAVVESRFGDRKLLNTMISYRF